MTAHIQIVGRNHHRYLAACLHSCLTQTIRAPVLYVDNASTDGSVAFVREKFPEVRVVGNAENRGYSGGHNDGLQAVQGTDIVIVLNPDVVLQPDFVAEGLVPFARERVGAVAPLLTRGEGSTALQSDVVDAYGDVLQKSLRAVNHYAGPALSDISNFDPPWGYTGAAAFLRRAALADIALNGESFDEDLFAYREDVDVSWRLRLRGWEIVGAPKARATHARAVRPGRKKDPLVARLSWRNYYLVLVKNAPLGVLIRFFPWIFLEDLARDIQWLVTPALWPAFPGLLRLLPRFLRKRVLVQSRASVAPLALGQLGRVRPIV